MTEKKASGVLSMVLVAAVVSLVVTVLRLVGELNGWNSDLFSNVAPNPEGPSKPGWVGISWLIPIFGFWFGMRLRSRTGEPKHAGKSALLYVIAHVAMVGLIIGLNVAGLAVMPGDESGAEPRGLGWMLGALGIALIVGIIAWPRLSGALILYAILARVPVIAVTYLALENGWDCHYTKLPVGMPEMEGSERFLYLAMPQGTFWIAATTLGGGLVGCLGAVFGKKRS